ncbi:hypothetical protein, partial [Peribacillus kribbensis]|uniref:hypothetical protein n=1 Tax=Peribacillus kribbensis TaxID=356658 RepID=UPI00047A0173
MTKKVIILFIFQMYVMVRSKEIELPLYLRQFYFIAFSAIQATFHLNFSFAQIVPGIAGIHPFLTARSYRDTRLYLA